MSATRRRLAATTAILALTATLAACSTGEEPTAEPPAAPESSSSEEAEETTEHNAADVEFTQMMIVHHQGALEMAELAVERASTEEVRTLAERIAAAQGPEIELMSGWLQTWDEELPAGAEHGGMDHGGMEMDGLDQSEAMAELESLTGDDVDRRFLELMTAHHRGAVEMSEELLDAGENGEARELAQKIIRDQEAEIVTMGRLLRGL